jgi:hypothetical protein
MRKSIPARPERVRAWLGASLLACCVVAPVAHASREFPSRVAGTLTLPLEPACALCHTRADAGFATGTLFQQALASRGFRRRDAASLDVALLRLEADGIDSDGDGSGMCASCVRSRIRTTRAIRALDRRAAPSRRVCRAMESTRARGWPSSPCSE